MGSECWCPYPGHTSPHCRLFALKTATHGERIRRKDVGHEPSTPERKNARISAHQNSRIPEIVAADKRQPTANARTDKGQRTLTKGQRTFEREMPVAGSIKLGQTAVEKRRHQVNKGPDSLSVLCPPPLSISAFLVIITLGPIFHNISKLKRAGDGILISRSPSPSRPILKIKSITYSRLFIYATDCPSTFPTFPTFPLIFRLCNRTWPILLWPES
uniref:HDC09390 n=1 Tax=Drosophila melanogaster TaxID=7227 RepID=Q6ILJ0_DROME|nr:TPA_inf: HDC09390 [Drosophila melanogaster]